jgi:uncharacterized protein YvpB
MKRIFILILFINSSLFLNCFVIKNSEIFNENYKQKYKLSCEIAGLRVLLAYNKIIFEEDNIFNELTLNSDPNLGFRGNKDGSPRLSLLKDYGVYAKPLYDFLKAKDIESEIYCNYYKYSGYQKIYCEPIYWILNEKLKKDKPVIIWTTFGCKKEKPVRFTSKGYYLTIRYKTTFVEETNKKKYKLIYNEHAFVAIGFDPIYKKIIVFDPDDGIVKTFTLKDFKQSWKTFDYMALCLK